MALNWESFSCRDRTTTIDLYYKNWLERNYEYNENSFLLLIINVTKAIMNIPKRNGSSKAIDPVVPAPA